MAERLDVRRKSTHETSGRGQINRDSNTAPSITTLFPFDTEDEAVAAANDTWGGLCASVCTADPVAAQRVAS
ncbi:aldehyde dehydrogenase family protein [Subtercola endophyticus]|uniref:aldehyde dehydrogenase family protein n=1 Tax=Subtercola endophyticus TaxID=2895559 RepID=UPI001E57042C|nr:aldehyde dehydrogenase family protein [Subtercola endophyticus]UFS58166.1 aldehyde dehydrogenase family protein [Subtercola endophyticus]